MEPQNMEEGHTAPFKIALDFYLLSSLTARSPINSVLKRMSALVKASLAKLLQGNKRCQQAFPCEYLISTPWQNDAE